MSQETHQEDEPSEVRVLIEPDWFSQVTQEQAQELFGKEAAELFSRGGIRLWR